MSPDSQRIRPTRPAPAIPQGLSRTNNNRRSAPQPPRRQSAVEGEQQQQQIQPQAAPRRSAPNLERQDSVEDNTNVRNERVTSKNFFYAQISQSFFPLFLVLVDLSVQSFLDNARQ